MNRIDQLVKDHMLASPAMFPTRLSVLSFLFLNAGGGYHWDKDGLADCIYGFPARATAMDMKDLDLELAAAQQRLDSDTDSLFGQHGLAEVELKWLQRQHLAKHIDVYAKHHDRFAVRRPNDICMLSCTYTLDGTLLGSAARVGNLDPGWAFAADDVATACLRALRQAKEDGRAMDNRDKLELELSAVLDALEPTTQRRAQAAKMSGLLQNMFERLTPTT